MDSEMERALLKTLHYRPATQRHRLDLIEVCTPADSPLTSSASGAGIKMITLPCPTRVVANLLFSAHDPPLSLPRGATGKLTRFDRDGDLVIHFEGYGFHTVFLHDANKLKFEG